MFKCKHTKKSGLQEQKQKILPTKFWVSERKVLQPQWMSKIEQSSNKCVQFSGKNDRKVKRLFLSKTSFAKNFQEVFRGGVGD